MNKEKNATSGEYFEFYKHIKKCNTEGALKCLQHLNEAAAAGNCRICCWILERRFPEAYGRREYRKINAVSENKNENIEIMVKDKDELSEQIITKLAMFR